MPIEKSPARAVWKTSKRVLEIRRRPLVMGILNVTPDSFSDGGRFDSVDLAVDAALQMQNSGADLVDIGGESTRPYSDPVDAETEAARVVPVIKRLADQLTVPISIDTSKASVAHAAMDAGAEIINDVTGLEGDAGMPRVALKSGAGVCAMHMRGTPQTMQDAPEYDDVIADIRRYLIARRDACVELGIELNSICLDPGIGFGKTHEHNLALLGNVAQFTDLGCVCLIGHSRKGFIRKLLKPIVERSELDYDPMAGTLGVSMAAAASGAHVLRVHDVGETVQALQLFEAAGGLN